MSWLKKCQISTKLGLLVAIPLFLLIFLTVSNYFSTAKTNHHFQTAYTDFARPATLMVSLRNNVQANQKNVLKIIVFKDPKMIADVKKDFDQRREQNSTMLADYDKKSHRPKEDELYTRVREIRNQFYALQASCIDLGMENRNDEAIQIFQEQLDPLAQEYALRLRALGDYLTQEAETDQHSAAEEAARANHIALLVAAVVVVLSILMSVLIARMITVPLGIMREKIAAFADGDLSVDFSDSGRDAISQMANALGHMVMTLRGVARSIQDAGGHISDSAQDFSALAEESNASVEECRANVTEMSGEVTNLASAGEEVNAAVEEVAAGAQATANRGTSIAQDVDTALGAGEEGISAVKEAVSSIDAVAKDAKTASQAVSELGNRARQIQNFVSQIGGIADQTNLLALNAAIEAARAGDAGRGFAVVAEEVRKLAEESNMAAKNIASLAGEITSDLDQVSNASQENAVASLKAVERAETTRTTIEKMIEALRHIASGTQDLAAVAEEQAASSEEIAETIQNMSSRIANTNERSKNISDQMEELATSAERVATGSENLAKLSQDLQEQVAYFKMDNVQVSSKARSPRLALKG